MKKRNEKRKNRRRGKRGREGWVRSEGRGS